MVEVVTLNQLKTQVSVDAGDSDHDDLLTTLRASAVRAVENRIGRTFVAGENAISEEDLPVARLAILMLVARWFRNREGEGPDVSAEMPLGVKFLLVPLERMAV